jgi:hypothetical protein
MRRHRRPVGVVVLTVAILRSWADWPSHAGLPAPATAQIDPLPMMAMARDLPTLRWTNYALIFSN